MCYDAAMAEPKPFPPAKLVAGLIFADTAASDDAAAALAGLYGPVDARSPVLPFDTTDYYVNEMGPGLSRVFVSFERLIDPSALAGIKLATNGLERELRRRAGRPGRVVNIDPGCLTASALVMATAKNFAHRVPLRDGIYGHLELLFGRSGIRVLDWTYPDMRRADCAAWFLAVRRTYLDALRSGNTHMSGS